MRLCAEYLGWISVFVRSLSNLPREREDNCGMGFRFRRSIKILPGVRLNFGKRGISTSIGIRGAHVTVGKTGTRTTVGLPGSGLSYTHLEKAHHDSSNAALAAEPAIPH